MAVPGRVPAISLGSVDHDSMFVSFQDGTNGGKPITVRQIGISTSSTGIQNVINVSGNTHTVGGLQQGTTYYVWARCGNADGWGAWGGPVSATTTVLSSPPGAPPAISISSVDHDSVFVSFQDGASSSPITQRQIAFGYTPDSTQFIYNAASTTAVISPLQSGMGYYFQARVANAYGWGPWSANVYAVTLTTATAPSAPPAVSISSIGAESVFLSWQDGNPNGSPITVRQIAFGYTPDSTQFIWNASGTTETISPLQPGTRYYFQVRNGNQHGWSSWSANVTALTLSARPPAPPPAISVSSITHNSMFVSFQDGADNGSPITVRQIAYGLTPDSVTNVINSGNTATLRNLLAKTKYYVQARVGNKYGWSAWSANAVGTTIAGLPSAAGVVRLSDTTRNSVTALVPKPADWGGVPLLELQLGYSTEKTAPTTLVTVPLDTGTTNVIGLTSGFTYYFWGRARNESGWGPWSPVNSVTLASGVYVYDGGLSKPAIPYVNVNGTWHRAQGWVRISGFWVNL